MEASGPPTPPFALVYRATHCFCDPAGVGSAVTENMGYKNSQIWIEIPAPHLRKPCTFGSLFNFPER